MAGAEAGFGATRPGILRRVKDSHCMKFGDDRRKNQGFEAEMHFPSEGTRTRFFTYQRTKSSLDIHRDRTQRSLRGG